VYYDDEILGTVIDLVMDNEEDEYYLQLHSHQTKGIANFIKSPKGSSNRQTIKNDEDSDEPSLARGSSSMSLRRRRSGLRSNRKRLMNTAQDYLDSKHLKSIPEVKEDVKESMRDLSSSEKAPKIHQKLLNDTILEERDSGLYRYNSKNEIVDDSRD
jgi:hypothetical protein